MIKREIYMAKIRPFINKEIVKVLTGIRRSGKSVMLELVKQELIDQGANEGQFLHINFESKKYEFALSVEALYEVVRELASKEQHKIYLMLDEIQELDGWEKLVNSCLVDFD